MTAKILFLGGSKFQIPPLIYAKEMGYSVITCDFLPENPGHRYADKYFNISTTDNEAVLSLAEREQVDAIVAYASDPAAPTQAYVGNKLGLPSNPYESVCILARKDLFRMFLDQHGFFSPESKSFYKVDKDLIDYASEVGFPLIVKPVDSSGSKGVSKIFSLADLEPAFEYAIGFSREKKVVIEEFFQRDGYQVAGDGFVVDGNLSFRCWANEHFDLRCNQFVPIGESFPSIMPESTLIEAHYETQRLLELLDIRMGALNFDFHYDAQGRFSFLELGPRNGGNLIPEVIKYSTGVDLVAYTVESALGNDCSDLTQCASEGFYASYMVHAERDGKLTEYWYSEEILGNIVEEKLYAPKGTTVQKFDGSHATLGTMILRFSSMDEMLHKMDNMENYFRVIVD